MIVLSACSYDAKSIDDCIEHSGKCYYSNESVKNEDSEIAIGLYDLLLDDEYDINYYYSSNPVDDLLWI